jgi:hypothetical protein
VGVEMTLHQKRQCGMMIREDRVQARPNVCPATWSFLLFYSIDEFNYPKKGSEDYLNLEPELESAR